MVHHQNLSELSASKLLIRRLLINQYIPTRLGAVRPHSPRPSISDYPVLSQLAVRLVAAPTTKLSGVQLHCYSGVAVDIAVDI